MSRKCKATREVTSNSHNLLVFLFENRFKEIGIKIVSRRPVAMYFGVILMQVCDYLVCVRKAISRYDQNQLIKDSRPTQQMAGKCHARVSQLGTTQWLPQNKRAEKLDQSLQKPKYLSKHYYPKNYKNNISYSLELIY